MVGWVRGLAPISPFAWWMCTYLQKILKVVSSLSTITVVSTQTHFRMKDRPSEGLTDSQRDKNSNLHTYYFFNQSQKTFALNTCFFFYALTDKILKDNLFFYKLNLTIFKKTLRSVKISRSAGRSVLFFSTHSSGQTIDILVSNSQFVTFQFDGFGVLLMNSAWSQHNSE